VTDDTPTLKLPTHEEATRAVVQAEFHPRVTYATCDSSWHAEGHSTGSCCKTCGNETSSPRGVVTRVESVESVLRRALDRIVELSLEGEKFHDEVCTATYGAEVTSRWTTTMDPARLLQDVEKLRERDAADAFWKDCYPEGMKPQDVKNELADFHFMMNQVPLVYDHVTHGLLSKPMYHANKVIGAHDDRCHATCAERSDVREVVDELREFAEKLIATHAGDEDVPKDTNTYHVTGYLNATHAAGERLKTLLSDFDDLLKE
jgi:hypothetical protein